MHRPSILALGALLCSAGCADPGTTETTAPPAGRSVTGNRNTVFRAADGAEVVMPEDLDRAVVQAHCPAADGSFEIVPGGGDPAGAFAIDGVPDGSCWIRVDRFEASIEPVRHDEYVWTSADHLDFDTVEDGRRDYAFPTQTTKLSIDADGLAPWREGEHLIGLYSPQVGFVQFNSQDFPGVIEGIPHEGETSVAGLSYDWSMLVAPLLDGARGDRLSLIQFEVKHTPGGVAYIVPVRSFDAPAFALEDGTTETITGTFAEPPALTYHFAWALSEFEAMRSDVHPRAGASFDHVFDVETSPGLTAEGWNHESFVTQLVVVDPEAFAGHVDVSIGDLTLGNPFPADSIFDFYQVTFPVELPWPDGTPTEVLVQAGRYGNQFPTAAEPTRPLIAPVRSIRIEGRDARSQLAEVGFTPEVSWEKPAFGTPSSFQIDVIEPGPGDLAMGGLWSAAGSLVVPGDVTSIRLPPDLLRPGGWYALRIRAITQPDDEAETAPLRRSLPYGWADALTETFTP